MTPVWFLLGHDDADVLGFLPDMLDSFDPRPAREQFDEHYHGGYWNTPAECRIDREGVMYYPGDHPQRPLAGTRLREELILLYPAEFVAIVQPDGSFVIQRMD